MDLSHLTLRYPHELFSVEIISSSVPPPLAEVLPVNPEDVDETRIWTEVVDGVSLGLLMVAEIPPSPPVDDGKEIVVVVVIWLDWVPDVAKVKTISVLIYLPRK